MYVCVCVCVFIYLLSLGYDKWGAWGQCSTATKCGVGSQTRSRPCLFNGKTVPNSNCTGVPVETKSCEMPGCRGKLHSYVEMKICNFLLKISSDVSAA